MAVGAVAVAAATLTAYTVCSAVLLRFPTLLHRKKRSRLARCRHISHRGGAGEGIENTLPAFQHAVTNCATDMLELDCQLTADGHVVVSHDNHLGRFGLPDVIISQTNYADLPALPPRVPIDFEPGVYYDDTAARVSCPSTTGPTQRDTRRIPLLSAVFDQFPDTAVNVDVKLADRRLVAAVSQLIDQYERHRLTVWGARDYRTARLCASTNPKVGLFCSSRSVLRIVVSAYLGLLPFLPIREDFFEIPMPLSLRSFQTTSLLGHYLSAKTNDMTGLSGDPGDVSRSESLHTISGTPSSGRQLKAPLLLRLLDMLMMRPFIFNHLNRRGIQVFLWVLNSEREFERAFDLGASGVMTDYPSRLRRFLLATSEMNDDK